MKKLIGVLCTVTILSSCSNDTELKAKAQANRRGPELNNNSAAPAMFSSDAAVPPSVLMRNPADTGYMPLPPVKSSGMAESYNTPPLGSMVEVPSRPSVTVGGGQMAALPSDRRAPELNHEAMSNPSGDLLAPVAPAAVSSKPQIYAAPLNTASSVDMPSGASLVPPPPPPMASMATPARADDYPKLAQVPPAPQPPQPASADPRVQQMKQELASMNDEQAKIQGGPTRVVVKSVSNGSATSPSISASAMPVPPAAPVIPEPPVFPPAPVANTQNNGDLRMPPAFANRAQQPAPQMAMATPPAELSPVPPAPPMQALPPAPVVAAPLPPVQPSASPALLADVPQAPMPPASLPASSSMPNPGLMPKGPTVVVRSNKSARQADSQEFASLPPAPQPAVLPPVAPVAPVYAAPAPLPPAAPAPVAQMAPPPAVLPPVAPAVSPLRSYDSVPQATASTLPSQLRPIPVEPVGPETAQKKDDEYATAPAPLSTRVSDLRPIASQHYQTLPDSRYARARKAANNSGYDQN